MRGEGATAGLILAALLTATGFAFAFTEVGAVLVFASWGLAVASAALAPSRRRVVAAAVIVLFFFYYVGAVLAVVSVTYETIRAMRAHRARDA